MLVPTIFLCGLWAYLAVLSNEIDVQDQELLVRERGWEADGWFSSFEVRTMLRYVAVAHVHTSCNVWE